MPEKILVRTYQPNRDKTNFTFDNLEKAFKFLNKKEEDISQTIDILGATDIYFKNTNDYIRICGSL